MIHIEQQKIYCSNTCFQLGTNDRDSQTLQKLETENVDLKCNLELLKRQIEKTKRRSVAFEDEVFDMEAYYKAELQKYKALTIELQQKLRGYCDSPVCSKSSSTKCDVSTQTIHFLKSIESQTVISDTNTNDVVGDYFASESDIGERATIATQTSTCFKDAATVTYVNDDTLNEALLLHSLLRIQVPKSTQTDRADLALAVEEPDVTSYGPQHSSTPISSPALVPAFATCAATRQDICPKTQIKKKILICGDASARNYSSTLAELFHGSLYDTFGYVGSQSNVAGLIRALFSLSSGHSVNDTVALCLDLNKTFIGYSSLKKLLAIGISFLILYTLLKILSDRSSSSNEHNEEKKMRKRAAIFKAKNVTRIMRFSETWLQNQELAKWLSRRKSIVDNKDMAYCKPINKKSRNILQQYTNNVSQKLAKNKQVVEDQRKPQLFSASQQQRKVVPSQCYTNINKNTAEAVQDKNLPSSQIMNFEEDTESTYEDVEQSDADEQINLYVDNQTMILQNQKTMTEQICRQLSSDKDKASTNETDKASTIKEATLDPLPINSLVNLKLLDEIYMEKLRYKKCQQRPNNLTYKKIKENAGGITEEAGEYDASVGENETVEEDEVAIEENEVANDEEALQSLIGTGGGPPTSKALTDLERQLLELISSINLGDPDVMDTLNITKSSSNVDEDFTTFHETETPQKYLENLNGLEHLEHEKRRILETILETPRKKKRQGIQTAFYQMHVEVMPRHKKPHWNQKNWKLLVYLK
ncbi:unnamed protein product [Ceutorhynchus assimilis]|uniref:Uncharacterized protein n=1 Tax=Ceutorhynchus assimilis TaxID=467358 RepID=A0A9N9MYH7_9CUCU|nr:unnamed protein product [Ceutorhynchus assimilis]